MQGRKLLLISDSCPVHTKLKNMPLLSNTEVFYLPPNTTSKLQPRDAGINRSFKAYYRRDFHQRLLQDIENGIADPMKFDTLDAAELVSMHM